MQKKLFSGTSRTCIILSHLDSLVFTLITFFSQGLPSIPPEISHKRNCSTFGVSLFYMLPSLFFLCRQCPDALSTQPKLIPYYGLSLNGSLLSPGGENNSALSIFSLIKKVNSSPQSSLSTVLTFNTLSPNSFGPRIKLMSGKPSLTVFP